MNTRNRYRNPLCSNSPWNCGGMYEGAGETGYHYQPFRLIEGSNFPDGKFRILRGQLYGRVFTMAERDNGTVDKISLLYGYSVRYSRNSCGFVQSRAARRRGYKSTDSRYNREANRWRGFCKRGCNGNPALIGKFVVLFMGGERYCQRCPRGCNWVANIGNATVFDYVSEALFYAETVRGRVAKVIP